jgi:hypothetical protein
MQIKFFSVPIPDGTVMEEEFNPLPQTQATPKKQIPLSKARFVMKFTGRILFSSAISLMLGLILLPMHPLQWLYLLNFLLFYTITLLMALKHSRLSNKFKVTVWCVLHIMSGPFAFLVLDILYDNIILPTLK